MQIDEITAEIDKLKCNYDINELQHIRKKLKNNKRLASKSIFHADTISTNYAFHYGGRSELQFNVGFEYIDEECFIRFGVAFSLEPSQTLPDASLLYPKIKRFNEFMSLNPNDHFGYKMWYWNKERSPINSDKLIKPTLLKKDSFIFFGKLIPVSDYCPDDILMTFDELLPLYIYVESDPKTNKENLKESSFNFVPNEFKGIDATQFSQAEKVIDVRLRHNDIQRALSQKLKHQFGNESVATEISSGIGNRVDVIVNTGKGYWFYEVKTYDSAKACIREALGQLLEYSYWPGAREAKKLIIVSEAPLDANASDYLLSIRQKMNIPIFYEQITI